MKYGWLAFAMWIGVVLNASAQGSSPAAPMPEVSVGRIERLPTIASKFVDARPVDVWLPADYTPTKRYQVLYMHDGQMLFDASKTWNKQAWDVHLSVDPLVRAGKIPDTIVVGVWNNGLQRYNEYFPEKFLQFLPEAPRADYIKEVMSGQARADNYLRFLVQELKPLIDARYSTRSDPTGTFVMGSSMGGLISLYAMGEYPQVFGGAAALSTHWIGYGKNPGWIPLAAGHYLRQYRANPENHRLYMDHGTTELDASYGPFQMLMDHIVRERGFDTSNSMSRVFEGEGHNERAWASRLEIPLVFLMGVRRP